MVAAVPSWRLEPSGSRLRSRSRSRSWSRARSWSWSRSGSRSGSWSWSGSRSGSWSGSGSRSGSRSGSWSGSGSGSGSRSWSGSGSTPPSLLLAHAGRIDASGQLARSLFYHGGLVEPFLDALTEGEPVFDFVAGESYYVETFGKHYVGRVTSVTGTTVAFADASWVAYSGRYGEFLRAGRADGMEVEYVGEMELGLAYISAKMPWKHALFTESV